MSKEQELIDELQEYLDIEELDTGNICLYPEEVQMCINALEKQVPKKVAYFKFGVDAYECPNCEDISLKISAGQYCRYCGQKIDWSEVE